MKYSKIFAVFVALLLTLVVIPGMVSARAPTIKDIQPGDTVFVYEQNLNVANLWTNISPGTEYSPTKFVKFSYDNPDPSISGGGQQLAEIPVNTDGTLSIFSTPAYFGTWYAYNPAAPGFHVNPSSSIQIQQADIHLNVVLSSSITDSVDGKTVTRQTPIKFRVDSSFVGPYYKAAGVSQAMLKIEVTTPGGGTLTSLGGVDLSNLVIGGPQNYTASIALTNAESGSYTAIAKWTIPNIEDSAPVSNAVSFTVSSKPLTISSNVQEITKGKDFTVTVIGEAKKTYYLYVKSTDAGDNVPQMVPGQVNVIYAPTFTGITDASNSRANVTLNAGGTITVEFNTAIAKDDEEYTIVVRDPVDPSNKYDSVDISVSKGIVTINVAGSGAYSLGDEIDLSGRNTVSDNVYLYLYGPNMNSNGVKLDNVSVACKDGNVNTFTKVEVDADDAWSYKWDTSNLGGPVLDAGSYVLYAATSENGRGSLSSTSYDTISINFKKPFITIDAIPNTVAAGDKLTITGRASGAPNNVYVWIFGKNYRNMFDSVSVQSDGTYSYKLDAGDTTDLYAGQYFVVVQHPMANGAGVVGSDRNGNSCSGIACYGITGNTTVDIGIIGLSGLQAPDAAMALTNQLDSPNIDDVYAKASFQIENPFIAITSIPDKNVGDKFAVTGTTNLAVGDKLQIDVISASFNPTQKTQSGEFSATSGMVTVAAGTGTYNVFTFNVDTSTFKPDQYLVLVTSVETSATATTSLRVLEKGIPTTTIATRPPTTITTIETTVETTVPTAIPTTTKSPGFGSVVALIGLSAVALLVLRRK